MYLLNEEVVMISGPGLYSDNYISIHSSLKLVSMNELKIKLGSSGALNLA